VEQKHGGLFGIAGLAVENGAAVDGFFLEGDRGNFHWAEELFITF
jgi:hypothetical protein